NRCLWSYRPLIVDAGKVGPSFTKAGWQRNSQENICGKTQDYDSANAQADEGQGASGPVRKNAPPIHRCGLAKIHRRRERRPRRRGHRRDGGDLPQPLSEERRGWQRENNGSQARRTRPTNVSVAMTKEAARSHEGV